MTLRQQESLINNPGSFSEWNEEDDTDAESRHLILPPPLSDEEVSSIQRTFNRVNRRVEGYLDCDELLSFMKLRKCPISLWEAKIILQYADQTYHYYISLNQMIGLATLYGLGTRSPIKLNRDEFKRAIKQAFAVNERTSSSSTTCHHSETNIPPGASSGFHGIVKFFESQVRTEDCERSEEDYDDFSTDDNNEDTQEPQRPEQDVTHSSPPASTERQSHEELFLTGPVKSMKEKWECAIKHNTSGPQRLLIHDWQSVEDTSPSLMYHYDNEPAEKPYEYKSHPDDTFHESKPVRSIYRRPESLDKALFEEMTYEARKYGLDSRPRGANKNKSTVNLSEKLGKKPSRSECKLGLSSRKTGPPTPPRPIIPDLPEEWLNRK